MLLRLFPISPSSGFSYIRPRASYRLYCGSREMGEQENSESEAIRVKRRATFRICNVSSFTTEILEIPADNPALHVLVIPGNPGVVSFYKDFVESLYELLGGTASVTAVGHISHTKKNWEHGRLFSLQEQIDHKMDFIKQELQNNEVPILLVGHSIGSYISLEMFQKSPEKVTFCVGLYPFLALNRQSVQQSFIGKLAASRILSVVLSLIVALLGLFPIRLLRLIVTTFLGKLWSATAVEATCSHLVKYHTMRNVLFMAMTEFRKLSATPDWAFMRGNQHKIAFLFGIDDHWGPLQMFEEISKQVPDVALSIEREGHTHAFGCTEAGSLWVAEHVAGLIKNNQAS
ncbi:lipid droplet-associated hydrolase isoform X5 [Pyrus x bretschneideri]|uniref:lipid droplet-associated hydrolase isoform X5 n=1 Tax=Pyrus x bretschneideri TaxID=225117 RepID=UPI000511B463|nr:lipid droplet-associated hydrolase isoform X5 [Pyrus x bretschneideri]